MLALALLASACAGAGPVAPAPSLEARTRVAHALFEIEQCTGFAAGVPGLGLTAAHCIPRKGKPRVRVGGETRPARVLYVDDKNDVAVLGLPAALYALQPLQLADPAHEHKTACRTGFPRGRLETVCGAVIGRATLADGAPRLLHLGGGGGGDSGSPLYDPATGELLGVHAHESDGVADAAPRDVLAAAIDEALEAGRAGRPTFSGEAGKLATRAGEPAMFADAVALLGGTAGPGALDRLLEALWTLDGGWARQAALVLSFGPPTPGDSAAARCVRELAQSPRALLLHGEDPKAIAAQAKLLEHLRKQPRLEILALPAGRRIGWSALRSKLARTPKGPARRVDDRLLEEPDLVLLRLSGKSDAVFLSPDLRDLGSVLR